MIESMEPRVLLAGVPLLNTGVLIQNGQTDLMVMANAAPCVGDWNGDGRKDLIVGQQSSGRVDIYLNGGTNANPLFAGNRLAMVGNQPVMTTYDEYQGSTPQVVDWNNDRRPDLITGEASGNIRVYLANANGLTAPTYVMTGTTTYAAPGRYSKPDVVDWNNDGLKDLVVGDGSGAVSVLLNTGTDDNPTFMAETPLLMGPDPLTDFLTVASFGGMASPVVADFNGDGMKDLVVGAADGKVYFFENVGTDALPEFDGVGKTLSAGGDVLTVGSNARPEVTDWDNNGIPDLLVGNAYGYVYFFRGQAAPQLTVSDATVTEGDEGTTIISFAATLSKAVDQPVTVHFCTSDGTATRENNDYLLTEGRLLIPAGQRTWKIDVLVVGDLAIEPDEFFYVDLTDPMGLWLVQDRVTGTITNDDSPLVTIEDAEVYEGNDGATDLSFPVSLSEATNQDVVIQYQLVEGTASSADGDFVIPATSTLTIPAGQTTGNIVVAVNGDTRTEPDEDLSIYLVSATNAKILTDPYYGTSVPATGLILNDDELGLYISNVSKLEGSSGGVTDFVFTVTLSEPLATPVTVQYATADGTAKAGSDYTAASGTLTIPANQTTATITVKVNADTANEPDETFSVVLSNSNEAAIIEGAGVGTIRNDDAVATVPGISVACTWPKALKTTIKNKQKTPVNLGTGTLGKAGPSCIFSITNVGDADLQVSAFRMPRGFALVKPMPTKIIPPTKRSSFEVYLKTNKIGQFSGNVTFSTNVAGASTFYIPVAGAVVKAAKAASRKVVAAAQVAGAFATTTKRIAPDPWLADTRNVL